MTIIPLSFSISRDPDTQKKLYTPLGPNSQPQLVPPRDGLPHNWQTLKGATKPTPSYAIRPDEDLIVIDCDDLQTTQALSALVDNPDDYIVISDKGEKHFYYAPTEYYRESRLLAKGRKKIGSKIDLLQGASLVYAPCALNYTKKVLQGTLEHLTPVPDAVVDYLTSLLKDTIVNNSGDYSPVTSYLAPLIEASLALYYRTGNYMDLQNMMALLTPRAFVDIVKPDYHPDRVPDGMGTDYLKGLRGKLGRDPSIDHRLFMEVMQLVTQKLWSAPLSDAQLANITKDIQQRTYDNGMPVFVYDPDYLARPLISMNNYPYMPVYRTIDDEFIIAKVNGQVELIKGISNFKKAVASSNFSLRFDKAEIKAAAQIPRVTEHMSTVKIMQVPYEKPGTFDDNGSLIYNTYVPTRYLSIIRGDYLEERKYKPNSTPTIDTLLDNLTADHPPETRMKHKLEQFLAYKLKTLEYSPLIFQLMGNRGTGKGTFIHLLELVTALTTRTRLNASNSQFNSDTAGKIFLNEDEGAITSNLVNSLKELSGNKTIRIEAKGKDAAMMRNIGTYIFSSNEAKLLAETVDDRRFVTLASFSADKLQIKNENLIFELEEWCLKLRDLHLTSQKLYTDATMWHDSIHYDLFKERTENVQDAPGQLAYLITTQMNYLTGEQLKKALEDILGEGFHYTTTPKGIKVYLANKSAAPTRKSDNSKVQHDVKAADAKNVGLGQYIKKDTNLKTYDKQIDYLVLNLSDSQLEIFTSVETVEPLEI